jgi:hypothetical protein
VTERQQKLGKLATNPDGILQIGDNSSHFF